MPDRARAPEAEQRERSPLTHPTPGARQQAPEHILHQVREPSQSPCDVTPTSSRISFPETPAWQDFSQEFADFHRRPLKANHGNLRPCTAGPRGRVGICGLPPPAPVGDSRVFAALHRRPPQASRYLRTCTANPCRRVTRHLRTCTASPMWPFMLARDDPIGVPTPGTLVGP